MLASGFMDLFDHNFFLVGMEEEEMTIEVVMLEVFTRDSMNASLINIPNTMIDCWKIMKKIDIEAQWEALLPEEIDIRKNWKIEMVQSGEKKVKIFIIMEKKINSEFEYKNTI